MQGVAKSCHQFCSKIAATFRLPLIAALTGHSALATCPINVRAQPTTRTLARTVSRNEVFKGFKS